MTFSASDLASSHAFFQAARAYATEMIGMFSENPRLNSIFASQQRWLMAQAGLALHFDRDANDPAKGLYAGRFISTIVEHGVASRNTAATFVQEMLTYRFVALAPDPPDKRRRPLEPTETAMRSFWSWMHVHLALLDSLDSGDRAGTLAADPGFFGRLQPLVAYGILKNHRVRNPGETFDLFTWANSGGVVMDFLIARLTDYDPEAPRISVGTVSSAEICRRYLISKTHLKRLLDKATRLGSLGVSVETGVKTTWISRSFINEYWHYQAEKFAIIDQAFAQLAQNASGTVTAPTAAP